MNSTADRTDSSVREIPFRPDGEVRIELTSGTLRVRGVDGDVVRIRVLDEDDDIHRVVRVEEAADGLDIREVDETALRIGPLIIGGRAGADLEIELPRATRVMARTASGDIEASQLLGEGTRWATASGDIDLQLDAGKVTFESMSGDVRVTASGTLAVDGRNVSGETRLHAPRFGALRIGTTSGDVRIDGALDATAHEVQTISGDTTIVSQSGIRLETATVTGDIRLRVAGTATEEGKGVVRIGDGAATLRWRSMSGDLTVRTTDPRREGIATDIDIRTNAGATPPTPPTPPTPSTPPTPPTPPTPVTPVPPRSSQGMAVPAIAIAASDIDAAAGELEVVAEALAAPNLVRRPEPAPSEPSTVADPVADPVALRAEARRQRTERQEEARMEILRSVERGELSIDDAAIRLAALDDAALSGGGSV